MNVKSIIHNLGKNYFPAQMDCFDAWQSGFSDVNTYIDAGSIYTAKDAMHQVFAAKAMQRSFQRVLEVGAGTGRFTAELVRHLPTSQIVCLDYMKNYATFLKGYAKKRWPQVTVISADFFSLTPETQYDLVVIPWLNMPKSLFHFGRLLKQSANLLKKRGILIFDFMDSGDDLVKIINQASSSPYQLYAGRDLEKIAASYGLQKVFERKITAKDQIVTYQAYTIGTRLPRKRASRS